MYLSEDVSVRRSFWQPDGLLMKVSPTFMPPVSSETTLAPLSPFVCTRACPTIKLSRCAVCIYVPVVIL